MRSRRGPRNNFPLVRSARYAFVAGGIGITPLLPMIATAEAAGATWRLLYGGRTRASMAFLDELSRYGERVEVAPQDERGLLDLAGFVDASGPETPVYACGPEPMLTAIEQVCAARCPELLRVERFQPQVRGAEAGGAQEFEVVLAGSGRALRIPADQSILDVLEAEGLTLAWSCREGTCGTCETAVLAGTPEHRDEVLTPAERESGSVMMICVSRARSDSLTLDL
jgi:ferredoxin-NADP reductase